MSRRAVLGFTAGLLVVVAALAWVRPLTRERTPVAATGAPAPVNEITPVPLKPGQLLCAEDIALGPRTQIAELLVGEDKRARPPLAVRVEAPGYRSPVVTVPAGPPGLAPVRLRVEPPPAETLGRLCVRNRGRAPVSFAGTLELRTYTKLRTEIDGEPVPPDVALTFYEDRRVSVLGDLPGIVDRMTTSRGFLGAAWFVWLVLAAIAIAVPVLVGRALYGALSAVSTDPRR